jgi:branched-chain amino acid transport system permease protein
LIDKGLWGPLRRRGTGLIAALVVSIGLALVMRYVFLYQFGGSSRSYRQYATQQPLNLGPISIPPRDLVIMGLSVLVLTAVGLALQRTRLGKATRAVADNPSLASSSGIDVERVINVVWIIGTALAVLGGVFLALSQQVSYLLGFQILLLLFAGVTLGGLGTAFGALVGSLVIGIFTQLSTLVIPAELQNVGALVVLILILVVRPQGILGRAERVG